MSYKEAIDIDTEDDLALARRIAENTTSSEKSLQRRKKCKEAFPNIENLIFDFDGVLGDTISVMEKHGLDVSKNLSQKTNNQVLKTIKNILGNHFLTFCMI